MSIATYTANPKAVGPAIREARERAGDELTVLAAELRISTYQLGKIERGEYRGETRNLPNAVAAAIGRLLTRYGLDKAAGGSAEQRSAYSLRPHEAPSTSGDDLMPADLREALADEHFLRPFRNLYDIWAARDRGPGGARRWDGIVINLEEFAERARASAPAVTPPTSTVSQTPRDDTKTRRRKIR